MARQAKGDAGEFIAKLKKANVTAKVTEHQLRISPSVFNDQQDIDKLLNALA